MTRAAAQSGYTLIELLVSLALLGLMMSLIGVALPLAISGNTRTSSTSAEISAIVTMHELLRRQIGEMQAIQSQDGYTHSLLFSGSADAMRFAASPVAAQGAGGPQIIELAVAGAPSARQLQYLMGDEQRNLVTNARSIRFSYYGAKARGSDPVWLETWKDKARLPSLVRIQVLPNAATLPWPDLVIAVMAQPPPP
ncbi:MAG: prepilin-type N-terminal cleavage/methylation domain-containing protein [Alphaproteobacteria bacterium]